MSSRRAAFMMEPRLRRAKRRWQASLIGVRSLGAAAAGLLFMLPVAHADCRSACQSDYYGCLHVNSTSTCSTARWICNNRCSAGAALPAPPTARSPIHNRPERSAIHSSTIPRAQPNAPRSVSAINPGGRRIARSRSGSTRPAVPWQPTGRAPTAPRGLTRVPKRSSSRSRDAMVVTRRRARSNARFAHADRAGRIA